MHMQNMLKYALPTLLMLLAVVKQGWTCSAQESEKLYQPNADWCSHGRT